MICAYNEEYLPLARRAMGEMYDYAVNGLKIKIQEFQRMFIVSGIARQFEIGNPAYVAGKPGCETAKEVVYITTGKLPDNSEYIRQDDLEYWIGSAICFVQWKTCKSYSCLSQVCSLDKMNSVYSKYKDGNLTPYAESLVKKLQSKHKETKLKTLRAGAKLSQRELATAADVPLRQIQLFEQGQRDINKTQGRALLQLATVLHCSIEDLLEE